MDFIHFFVYCNAIFETKIYISIYNYHKTNETEKLLEFFRKLFTNFLTYTCIYCIIVISCKFTTGFPDNRIGENGKRGKAQRKLVKRGYTKKGKNENPNNPLVKTSSYRRTFKNTFEIYYMMAPLKTSQKTVFRGVRNIKIDILPHSNKRTARMAIRN